MQGKFEAGNRKMKVFLNLKIRQYKKAEYASDKSF
jgi:hypothetical protein